MTEPRSAGASTANAGDLTAAPAAEKRAVKKRAVKKVAVKKKAVAKKVPAKKAAAGQVAAKAPAKKAAAGKVAAKAPAKKAPAKKAPDTKGPPTKAAAPTSPDSWVERVVAGERVSRHRGWWGVAWFVVATATIAVGPLAVAVLFAAFAAVAGLQTSAAWRRARRQPIQLVAGAGAALLVLSALVGIAMVGVVALLYVGVALAMALLRAGTGRPGAGSPLAVAGLAVRCGFFFGVAGATVVFLARSDQFALFILLVLVSAYEVGDYLVGTGASTPFAGPVAGLIAVAVFTFGLSVFQLGPFDPQAAWVFGGLAGVLACLGTIVASTFVPTASIGGPALRRLDSWLLVAPVWAWMLWDYLG